jgi:ribosomal protein L11 methyltransferase
MAWIHVHFDVSEDRQEIALAMLSELPFSMFEEKPDGLHAFSSEDEWEEDIVAVLDRLGDAYWSGYTLKVEEDQNWNEVWESNFQPVVIDDFCAVRAIFHEPIAGVKYELIIQPEMAFGTGHHATTMMMIRGMATLDIADKRVLDFGAGTAILAMLAARLGALQVDAVEIEAPACESAQRNLIRNQVEKIVTIIHGDISFIPDTHYDLILANINRNVLLEALPTLNSKLNPGGILGISGFLVEDIPLFEKLTADLPWELIRSDQEGNWVALWWKKRNTL